MNLTSFSFISFLLVAVIIYYLLPFSYWKRIILLSAGLVFYTSFCPLDLVYLFAVTFYSYTMCFLLEEKKSSFLLAASIIPMILGLCFYKYAGLFQVFEHMSLAAPLGISFFTFKVISYLVDVYQGRCEIERSFLSYFLYVSFFPQISSGPIQRPDSFFKQLNTNKKMNHQMMRHGFHLVLFGFFEKVVIADRLYLVVDHCFSDMSLWNPSIVMIGCIAYSFQIYADFDAYSNLAIGIGELFGISCERNFHAPYMARNIKEFWSRWHISLSSWLKDYIYLPLGGSKKGFSRKILNILAVFLVSGLWHGSTWNFLLWGLLNGLFRILYDVFERFIFSKIRITFKPFKWMISLLGIALNFVLVTCLWIFFRCNSLIEIQMIYSYLQQIDFSAFQFAVPELENSELMITALMTLLLVICDVLRNIGFTMHHFGKLFFPIRWLTYAAILVLGIIFAVYGSGYDPSKFIYIQF
ncbi:MAG: MBOAT family protein [Erysipelotrichaceae bacterium]|nr:MBOAT family protein [Erysipelotrichaceae bacterium]